MAHSYLVKGWWFQSHLNSTFYQMIPGRIMPEYLRLLYMVQVVMNKYFDENGQNVCSIALYCIYIFHM